MRVNFPIDLISGHKPADVSQILTRKGIDPKRPYSARLTPTAIIIEQRLAVS